MFIPEFFICLKNMSNEDPLNHKSVGALMLLPAVPSFGFVHVTALLCWLEPFNLNPLIG